MNVREIAKLIDAAEVLRREGFDDLSKSVLHVANYGELPTQQQDWGTK